MTPREVSLRISGVGLALLALAGCYDAPKPDCGFRCGPNLACPSDYTCASDNRCHLNGSPANLNCVTPDSGPGPDAYSPNATLFHPAVGDMLNPADPIIVRFDVDVTGVDTSSFTVNASGTALFVVGTVSYSSRQAQFFRSEGLPPLTDLTVTLSAPISDPVSGRPLLLTTFDLRTLADSTPPMIVQTAPTTMSVGNGVATNLLVRFSEPVMGLSGTTFTMFETAVPANTITGAISYDFDTRTATFNPVDQLTPNLGYTARITAGVTDAAGNPIFNPPFLMNFTTGADTVIPSVRTTVPVNMDANVMVSANIVVTFDEPIVPGTVDATSFQVNAGAVTGTITASNGNKTFTFDPDSDLPAGSTINVTLSTAITDTSSNALAAFAFAFTTM